MIDLSGFNFSKAEGNYLVANTPLFIVRNLKSDQAVIKISRMFPGDAILAEIKERLVLHPETTRNRVIPFVLVVALSLKQDWAGLAELSKLDMGNYRWLAMVVEALVTTARPYSINAFDLSSSPTMSTFKSKSSHASNATTSLTATLVQ